MHGSVDFMYLHFIVRCNFFRIYVSTFYSTVFLLHAHAPEPAPVPIRIGFGAMRCGVGAVLRFGLNSFGTD